MTGSWWKRLIIGLVVVLVCLVLIPRFGGNGQFYQPIVFPGIALGAVLALVPGAGYFGRVAAFLMGGAVATVAYLLRAAIFPQTPTGVALASALIVLILTIVWVASVGYWPLWASLSGAVLVQAGYEARFGAYPPLIVEDLLVYIFPVLAAAAVSFVVVLILAMIFGEDRLLLPEEQEQEEETPPPAPSSEAETVSMTPAQ